jgi:hypothetical protein
MSHLSLDNLAAPSMTGINDVFSYRQQDAPIDPPAEIEQYSNSPSKMGQSSPTLSFYVSETPKGAEEADSHLICSLAN